jgi:hypothetical protein
MQAATYYVSPSGDDRSSGSASAPWRTVDKAARTAVAGDTVLFRTGLYRETLQPAHSGTSEERRITFKAAPREEVIFEGGSDRLLGWAEEANNIYSLPWTADVKGVFEDTYEATGKHTALWNMDTNPYDSNPNLDFHDFDPAHDLFKDQQKHDWRSQYKWANGVLRVRTSDGRSPDEHDVRVAILQNAVGVRGKSFITIAGIKACRFAVGARVEASRNIRIVDCDFRYSSHNAVYATDSSYLEVKGCVLQGGGSWIGHSGDTVSLGTCPDSRIEENDVSYGGHSGIQLTGGSPRSVIRGNYVHDCGGILLNITRGADRSLIEDNVFARAPYVAETSLHKTAHGAIALHGLDSIVRRNLLYHVAYGIGISPFDGTETRGNRIYHNTIVECEWMAIWLQAYSADEQGKLNDNEIKNNIFVRCAKLLQLDLPGGDQQDWWGNRFESNLFWEGRPWFSGIGVLRVAEAERRWPGVFRNNQEADPQFVDTTSHDYRLQVGSPAIDAGVNLGLRYAGLAPDIGAFELNTSDPNTLSAPGLKLPDRPVLGPSLPTKGSGLRK